MSPSKASLNFEAIISLRCRQKISLSCIQIYINPFSTPDYEYMLIYGRYIWRNTKIWKKFCQDPNIVLHMTGKWLECLKAFKSWDIHMPLPFQRGWRVIGIPVFLLNDKKPSWFHSCFGTSLKPLILLKTVILHTVLSSLTPSAVIRI